MQFGHYSKRNNMSLLFIFLDGVGLGADDPKINPLASAKMPILHALLGKKPLIASTAPYKGEHATLLALDASLSVEGRPQSATGQATLLTGINIPAEIGYHYGPKPNKDVRQYLQSKKTIFSWLRAENKKVALLNAYPDGYFKGINSGKRLYSAIPLAVTEAEFPLFTAEDLYEGRALSADFTGEGWLKMLKDEKASVFTPENAGKKLAELTMQYDFSFFEYWASDYAGHKQDMDWGIKQLEAFDGVLAGLLKNMPKDLLILITSDHGNMEDMSTRKHTEAPVPCLIIGTENMREKFIGKELKDLADITPAIKRIFN
jgi:2,3-bisphosphoglycerate-independent phosphoglycerate mutase